MNPMTFLMGVWTMYLIYRPGFGYGMKYGMTYRKMGLHLTVIGTFVFMVICDFAGAFEGYSWGLLDTLLLLLVIYQFIEKIANADN